ncbi:molybdenum cofactor biosynthesis protein MoaB [Methanoculleus sp. YWC-01]|jgi:molybdenum cofactor biosynthesis protein B|uniref:Molybdenum cofactor biosynthesis protein MoaB n=1 Tax=Methanoculleus nereidis TaxID=2735141 RepID=A0ABU3YZ69_9EURY|nr:molybdenum cofactor biosynthesis protein B [Methanoculleus sp. YWC-01]MCK9297898.1 molybdenum cofactor biosynthesis protein MoaB [Methanoculleus sp.]MDV4341821.1 molybdenum cofactor biosynthesis protein MoaB [Methanoculleus sp. YWC-01]PKL55588.1 MAG: molybdenum cofactor biosynthesis protein [Methanomicrobiales archaeon HGW-Methanomicrobiales-6]
MESNHLKPLTVNGAVITVSSTRTPETDTSGKALIDLLSAAEIEVTHYAIVPDDLARIRSEVRAALSCANCVIVTGGTGLTSDDVTIEAVAPLLEKIIDGFGELFRLKSYEEIGTAAILSRAIAGVVDGRAVFCIPGSTKAVTLAAKEIIIPEIRHILTHAGAGR